MKNTLFRVLSVAALIVLAGCCRDRDCKPYSPSCGPCDKPKKKMICNPCETVCPPVKTCEDRIEPVYRKIRRCVEVTEEPQGLVCYDPETGEELDHVKMEEGMKEMPMQKKGRMGSTKRRGKMKMDDMDDMDDMMDSAMETKKRKAY